MVSRRWEEGRQAQPGASTPSMYKKGAGWSAVLLCASKGGEHGALHGPLYEINKRGGVCVCVCARKTSCVYNGQPAVPRGGLSGGLAPHGENTGAVPGARQGCFASRVPQAMPVTYLPQLVALPGISASCVNLPWRRRKGTWSAVCGALPATMVRLAAYPARTRRRSAPQPGPAPHC